MLLCRLSHFMHGLLQLPHKNDNAEHDCYFMIRSNWPISEVQCLVIAVSGHGEDEGHAIDKAIDYAISRYGKHQFDEARKIWNWDVRWLTKEQVSADTILIYNI